MPEAAVGHVQPNHHEPQENNHHRNQHLQTQGIEPYEEKDITGEMSEDTRTEWTVPYLQPTDENKSN